MEIIKESKQYQVVVHKDAIMIENNLEYVFIERQKDTIDR